MNDFDDEVLQKKRLARQAFHKKGGSKSRKCPMSTDRMTRKQWIERCGEVVTYELGKPMGWEAFKQMPVALQKEYLLLLIDKYSTTASDLARMFGITSQTVTRFCGNQEIGIEFSRGKRMSRDNRAEFERFLCGADDDAVPAALEPKPEQSAPELSISRQTSGMDMTAFSLSFEGVIKPETVVNSIISMLRPGSSVRLEVKCQVLP